MCRQARYRRLSPKEIKGIEDQVDKFFEMQSVPGRTQWEARWKVLTAVEDSLRFLLAQNAPAWIDPAAFEDRAFFVHTLDRYKYSLKYALDIIEQAGLPNDRVDFQPFGESGDDYLQVNRLLHRDAILYADAVGTFTSIWGEDRPAYGKASGQSLLITRSIRDIQYHSIEALTAKHADDFSPVPLIAAVFSARKQRGDQNEQMEWGETIKELVKSVRVRNGKVSYQFVAKRGVHLYDYVTHTPSLIPPSWLFPWGSFAECTSFSVALISLCFYHLIAVHFGAAHNSLRGVGINEIGLTLSVAELRKRIGLVSGLSTSRIDELMSALTYGTAVKTPDPALQPLISVGNDILFVPCLMVITNNWPRNMLALHARVNSNNFDSQSSVFENVMTASIVGHSACYKVIPNTTFSSDTISEEIDLLYVDVSAKTLLVCELKWSIPPGDPRQVINRRKAVGEKVLQAKRKAGWVTDNIQHILSKLHIVGNSEWTCRGIVVLDGFSGIPSQIPNDIPVVPKAVFTTMLDQGLSIDNIHKILCTPLWLPRPDIDFTMIHKSDRIGNVEIHDFGYRILKDTYIESSLPRYLSESLTYSFDEITNIMW